MQKESVYRKYIFDEMSKNKQYDLSELEKFINSLNDRQAKQLCKYFSLHRRNHTYDFISKGPKNWRSDNIDICNIYVEKVNPVVNHYLEKNSWSLKRISEDIDIQQLDEFKSQGPIDIKILSFIAKKNGDTFRIVDGMHRVIKLAFDGKKQFKLIYY